MAKTATKGAKRGRAQGDKNKFVRTQPLDTPAADVAAKAKKKGLNITPAHIYSIRNAMRKEQGLVARRTAAPASRRGVRNARGRRKNGVSAPVIGTDPAVVRLQTAILDVGFARATKVFEDIRTNLAVLLEGQASTHAG